MNVLVMFSLVKNDLEKVHFGLFSVLITAFQLLFLASMLVYWFVVASLYLRSEALDNDLLLLKGVKLVLFWFLSGVQVSDLKVVVDKKDVMFSPSVQKAERGEKGERGEAGARGPSGADVREL